MELVPEPSLLQRTRRRLSKSGDAARRRLLSNDSAELSDRDRDMLVAQIQDCVAPTTGEVTARQLAADVGERYRNLDPAGQTQFFDLLAEKFAVDSAALDRTIAARQRVLDAVPLDRARLQETERAMRGALVSPREILFSRFNGLDGGVKFVVDLRADLRTLRRDPVRWTPQLQAMDRELKDVLGAWFDVGNLELRQITWDTPASLLEKLIEYESVHEIESWHDLRNRLDTDRRCYAFFHPGMQDEPLIFVEVALTKGIAGNLPLLLDLDAPELQAAESDTAIFYSISNCQTGLAGVNLGNLLIKRVVAALVAELPNLTTFSTLSPLPGFRAWLSEELATRSADLFTSEELFALRSALAMPDVHRGVAETLDRNDWHTDPPLADALEAPLMRLGARYISQEKRGSHALDRVANFHLSNGARVERLNWLANPSPVGLSRSAGIMVNYRYVPEYIPDNHTAYVADGHIHISSAMDRWFKDPA